MPKNDLARFLCQALLAALQAAGDDGLDHLQLVDVAFPGVVTPANYEQHTKRIEVVQDAVDILADQGLVYQLELDVPLTYRWYYDDAPK